MSTNPPAPEEQEQEPSSGLGWILALIAAVWLPTVNQLRFEWSMNQHYAFGWFVPFLTLYLVTERWKVRPASDSMGWPKLFIGLIVAASAWMLPLRLIQEANPDWRMLSWAMAMLSVAVSLGLFYYAGGTTWMRYFAFPICFMLIAVPWPVFWEQTIVQGLMRAVTQISVEALGWFAIPAFQEGNVITVSKGSVGVEEACSGVRSLQTALMISLFLGELFRLGTLRRIGMFLGAVVIAFLWNVVRSVILVWICAQNGPDMLASWHDIIGNTVLVLTLLSLAGFAALLRQKKHSTIPTAADAPSLPRLPSKGILAAFATWLILIEALTEGWYRYHERGTEALRAWSLQWPESQPGFREVKISDNVRSLLLFDEARSATWTEPNQTDWTMIFVRWKPGRVSTQRAYSHAPEFCLTSHGATMVSEVGLQPMKIGDVDLPLRAYIFNIRGRPMYVFYCIWEQYYAEEGPRSAWRNQDQGRRIDSVLAGRRNRGQLLLEIGVSGIANQREAQTAVQKMLERVVR